MLRLFRTNQPRQAVSVWRLWGNWEVGSGKWEVPLEVPLPGGRREVEEGTGDALSSGKNSLINAVGRKSLHHGCF